MEDLLSDKTSSLIEDSFIKLSSLSLHVVQAGPVDGELVVLLHGFPEFWYGWRKQIVPLAEAGFRVVVPDQRGYNLSGKPVGVSAYALPKLVGDVAGLVSSLGREKCRLVGHDWGAAVAWETALAYPNLLERLVILNVPHPDVMVRFLGRRWEQTRKSWYIFAFQLPRLPEWLIRRRDFAALQRALTASADPEIFSAQDLDAYREAWAQPGALTAMLNWYRAAFRAGLRQIIKPGGQQLRRVQPPTLMLWGKHDVALSWEMAEPSIKLCEQGELVMFENATHWVQHDEAQAVTQHLLTFLVDR